MVETEMEQTVSELRETELGDKNHKRINLGILQYYKKLSFLLEWRTLCKNKSVL